MSEQRSPGQRGAVLYDYLLVRGGAERVSLLLAREFDADLWVGFRDPDIFPLSELTDVRLHAVSTPSQIVPWRYIKYTRAFARKATDLADYDWVLYSGSCAPAAVIHRPGQRNIYYCHAMPSFAYELQDHYLSQLSPPLRPALRALAAWLRPRYEQALRQMDVIIANSKHTQALIKEHLSLDSEVVYPPVDVDRFEWGEPQGYYLSTARLELHKRVDVIIDAFREMPDKQLIVAGWGSAGELLRRRAAGASNIRFTGWVDQDRMRELLKHCIASIYLGKDEPFGLSPVESLAAGKPVIGVIDGGVQETIIDGKQGLLLSRPPTSAKLLTTAAHMTSGLARRMRPSCENRSRQYAQRVFLESIRRMLGSNLNI